MARAERLHHCRIEAKENWRGQRSWVFHQNSQYSVLPADALAEPRQNIRQRIDIVYRVVDPSNKKVGVTLHVRCPLTHTILALTRPSARRSDKHLRFSGGTLGREI